jgi:hypothetical protein
MSPAFTVVGTFVVLVPVYLALQGTENYIIEKIQPLWEECVVDLKRGPAEPGLEPNYIPLKSGDVHGGGTIYKRAYDGREYLQIPVVWRYPGGAYPVKEERYVCERDGMGKVRTFLIAGGK